MPTPFANLEARIHRSVRDRLANAEATVGAATVSGLFRMAYAEAIGGLAGGSQPVFECEAADVPGIAYGSAMSLGGIGYTVASVEPDGTGWLRLLLQRAA